MAGQKNPKKQLRSPKHFFWDKARQDTVTLAAGAMACQALEAKGSGLRGLAISLRNPPPLWVGNPSTFDFRVEHCPDGAYFRSFAVVSPTESVPNSLPAPNFQGCTPASEDLAPSSPLKQVKLVSLASSGLVHVRNLGFPKTAGCSEGGPPCAQNPKPSTSSVSWPATDQDYRFCRLMREE